MIDENPAPLAAIFHIGPNAIIPAISTRVRVNSYTNVHAVAELTDGKLYVVETYVKASGGCSAPAVKAEKTGIGEMRFRQFAQIRQRAASNMAADHDPSPEQFGTADGSGHASLCSGLFRAVLEGLARGRAPARNGREHLDLRRSQYPIHICSRRFEARFGPKRSIRTVTCSRAVGRSSGSEQVE